MRPDWQPWVTAPRDRRIMAWYGGDPATPNVNWIPRAIFVNWDEDSEYWEADGYDFYFSEQDAEKNITHWAEAPEGPK